MCEYRVENTATFATSATQRYKNPHKQWISETLRM